MTSTSRVLGVAVWLADGGGDGATLPGLLTPGVLIALLLALAVLLVIAAITGWVIWRRVRRSGLLARGRTMAQRGLVAAAAQALPDGPRRDLAGLHAQVSRSRAELARRVASATAAGGYLGDLPAVLPRLNADGLRLERALSALLLSGDEHHLARAQPDVAASARAYLDAAGRALAAVGTSEAAAREPRTAQLYADVDDAVAGLNAYSDAYRELGGEPN